MRSGIAVWTMSKVVMFIFLILVFFTVVFYTKILNERVAADSAEALALQIKSKLTSVIATDALEVKEVVALPDEIPEREKNVYDTSEIQLKTYTLVTMLVQKSAAEKFILFAISFNDKENVMDNVYLASSWLLIPDTSITIQLDDSGTGDCNILSSNTQIEQCFKMVSNTQIKYIVEKDTSSGTTILKLKATSARDGDCVGGC